MRKVLLEIPTHEEVNYIDQSLMAYNHSREPFLQTNPFIPVNRCLKNENGEVIAGVLATLVCWHVLYVDVLWVDPRYRRQGYGSQLLAEAEKVAKALGVINGLLVTRLGLPAFLATLGMMQVIRGAAMWITNTEAVPISNTVFNTIFGTGFVGPISVLILWTILFYILGYILFNRTPFGKHTLATGGNQMAAQYSGIKVQRIKMYVFMLSGALSAFAGVLYAGRMQSGRYSFGDGDEMSVIASVVLGGASMAGGSGSMIGALAGSILMGMISNALILANLSSAQQKMVNGFIIIAAVALSNLAQRKKSN